MSPSEPERQRVVRVPGSRRAKLTPAPGTDPSPELPPEDEDAPTAGAAGASEDAGPNDERMRRDVPPHY